MPSRRSARVIVGFCWTQLFLTTGCVSDATSVSSDATTPAEPIAAVSQAISGARFGTWCTRSYEDGWSTEQPHAWDLCGGFKNELNDTDTSVFYYDLNNKKYYWEKGGDHQAANDSADDVDLLWVATHGSAAVGATSASFAMWNYKVSARSSQMRLGDSANWGGGLAILATYACETLTNQDGNLVKRWAPALRGGLKMILGSHETLYGGDTTDDCGANFADNLQKKYSIRTSWRDGLIDWYVAQDPAIVATGSTCNDCSHRRDSMTWQNYGTFPFLRDGEIGCTCWAFWYDI